MKVKVNIEEHLVKTIEVDVDIDDPNKAIEMAENYVMDKYAKDEIKLTKKDDFSGITLVMTEEENGISTDWHNAYTPDKDDIPSDNVIKLVDNNTIRILARYDSSLPKNTVALSVDEYEKYIGNENSFYLARYPMPSSDQLIKLSNVNVIPSPFKLNYCAISSDIALKLQLDLMYDVICIFYKNE